MGNRFWQPEEVAVILFFASRGVIQAECHRILLHKCRDSGRSSRNFTAVRGKLLMLRNAQGLVLWGSERKSWNKSAVDQYLQSLQIPNLEAWTSAGEAELNLMAQVIHSLSLNTNNTYNRPRAEQTFLRRCTRMGIRSV